MFTDAVRTGSLNRAFCASSLKGYLYNINVGVYWSMLVQRVRSKFGDTLYVMTLKYSTTDTNLNSQLENRYLRRIHINVI